MTFLQSVIDIQYFGFISQFINLPTPHTPPPPAPHTPYLTPTPTPHTPRNNMTFLQSFHDIQSFGFISQFFTFSFTEVYVHILILNVSAISTVLLLHCSAWFGKL